MSDRLLEAIQADLGTGRADLGRIRVARTRVLAMRAHKLLSPHRGRQGTARVHAGTYQAPNVMWGTRRVFTLDAGWIFTAVEHWNAECVGWHVCKVGSRFAALEPIAQGLRRIYGALDADSARGLALRMDHGSQYLSDHFLNQIQYWGIRPSYGFVEEPETNGVAERWNRTLKEQAIHGRIFQNLKDHAGDWPSSIAHLQVGLTMQDLDAPLADDGTERAGVYLTNALTGWEPRTNKPLPFPELEEERDRADRVKQERPILVILGNPPYNGFAGMAVDEERELSDSYRTTKRVRPPEGPGLNDPYIRFFRMAERRIAERTGRGVVCFISNYSWLDGLSFTGMRERYLEAFDAVRIDCLNGDKYKTGKVAPDGSPDPSIFSTDGDPVGIQVGTAIATLIRKADHTPSEEIEFRHLWGQAKPEELIATAEAEPDALYDGIKPVLPLGLPFLRTAVSDEWFDWPALPDLFPVSFPGVKTSRDGFLVDVDLDRLRARVGDYFDPNVSHEEMARRYPGVMKTTAGFNARKVRDALLARGGPDDAGFIRFAYRPFDTRWLYWEADGSLLDRPRPDYRSHVFEGNLWLVFQNKARPDLSPPLAISNLGDLNQMNSGVYCVPALLSDDGLQVAEDQKQHRPNLSRTAQSYLERLDADALDLVHHLIAVLHEPIYNRLNADALRAEGPRIPLPGWGDGESEGVAATLAHSAARGRELARLLDPNTPVPGVTEGELRPGIAPIAVPATADGRNMTGEDLALTAGWGHSGSADAVMPGQGRVVERAFTPSERTALGDAASMLGGTTFDIYLNQTAFWCNVPAVVWTYKLGGYQVLKKWLSYRERGILGRALTPHEVQYFTEIARRIAAILTTAR